jgi:hypothetical protein
MMTGIRVIAADMPKTEFLQIRCTPDDRERMQKVAATEHLDLSTWARRILLQAVDKAEAKKSSRLKVAEESGEFRKDKHK